MVLGGQVFGLISRTAPIGKRIRYYGVDRRALRTIHRRRNDAQRREQNIIPG